MIGARRALASRPGAVLIILLALVLAAAPGCASVGRAGYECWSWGGATFTPNPVAVIPYWTGFVLFAIVGLPFDLLSWPLTALFFPGEREEPSREFYLFAASFPSVVLGTGGGTLLGGIFYPFGIPFMDDRQDWDRSR